MSDGVPVNRQAERSERSTEALLRAASELIATGGLDAMTFAAIGERAGYSRGLVTARFGSKDGLVDAMIRRTWRRLRVADRLGPGTGAPGLDQIVDLLDAIATDTRRAETDMRALTVLLLGAAVAPEGPMRDRLRRFDHAIVDELTAAIERGIEDGSVRADLDPGTEALHIAGAMRGVAYLWVVDPERFDGATAYETLRDVTAERLRPTS